MTLSYHGVWLWQENPFHNSQGEVRYFLTSLEHFSSAWGRARCTNCSSNLKSRSMSNTFQRLNLRVGFKSALYSLTKRPSKQLLTFSRVISVSAACVFFSSILTLSDSAFSLLTAVSWSLAALCFSSSRRRPSSTSCCFRWEFTLISSSLNLWTWASMSAII